MQVYFGDVSDTVENSSGARRANTVVHTYTAVTADAAGNPTVPVAGSEFTAWFKDSALTVPVVPTSDARGYMPRAYCADGTPALYGGAQEVGPNGVVQPPSYVALLERRDVTGGGGGYSPPVGGIPKTDLAAAVQTSLGKADTAVQDVSALETQAHATATYGAVVKHGSTASTARPAGAVQVLWVGTVNPTNAATDDEWIDKSTSPATLRRYTGSAFEAISGGAGVAGVSSFQTRTGAVTLTKADVTGTGLAASDVSADASGAASTAQSAAAADVTARAALKANNLSDLASAATARTNLGLGTAATQPSSAFDAAGAASTETARATTAEAGLAYDLTENATALTASGNATVGKVTPLDTTSAAVVATLPAGSADRQMIGVRWKTGSANAASVTGTISGGTNTIAMIPGELLVFRWDAASSSWWSRAGNKPLTSLDSRYDAAGAAAAVLPTQTGNAGKFLTTSGSVASWATPAGGGSSTGRIYGLTSARWFVPLLTTDGSSHSNQATEGLLYCVPFILPAAVTLDRMGVSVNSVGSTGAVARVGLYADTGSAYPGALILDAGTLDCVTGGTNVATTVSVVLAANTLYWAAIVTQGGATTRPFLRCAANNAVVPLISPENQDNAGNSSWVIAFTQAGVTGALPSTFTSTRTAFIQGGSNGPPHVEMRVA